MAAKISMLGKILSSNPYLRSAMLWFPIQTHRQMKIIVYLFTFVIMSFNTCRLVTLNLCICVLGYFCTCILVFFCSCVLDHLCTWVLFHLYTCILLFLCAWSFVYLCICTVMYYLHTIELVYQWTSVQVGAPENLKFAGSRPKMAAICGLKDYKKKLYL